MTNNEKTYKACILEHSTLALNVTIQHFVIVKGNDIEDALSNIINHLKDDILERKCSDFNFEKIDMKPNHLWDIYFQDRSQGLQINLKDITNDTFKNICIKHIC